MFHRGCLRETGNWLTLGRIHQMGLDRSNRRARVERISLLESKLFGIKLIQPRML